MHSSPEFVYSVSCVSSSDCEAISGAHAYAYNGSTWTKQQIDSGRSLTSLSCDLGGPGSTLSCVAVDNGGYFVTLSSGTWSSPAPVATGDDLDAISCMADGTCTALVDDPAGSAFTYSGSSWSSLGSIDPTTGGLTDISCVGSSFCVAVDGTGNAVVFSSGSWATPDPVDPGEDLVAVSCSSTTFCMAYDADGNYLTYDGVSWTTPAAMNDGYWSELLAVGSSLTCVETDFCMAVLETEDGVGDTFDTVAVYTGTNWDGNGTSASEDGSAPVVSCASESYCVAIGPGGDETDWADGQWSDSVHTQLGDDPPLDCVATDDCLAFSGTSAFTYDGTTWTAIGTVKGAAPETISCASTTFCLATGASTAYIWSGTSWSLPTTLHAPQPSRISCGADDTCMGVSERDAIAFSTTQPPTITTKKLPDGEVTSPYSASLAATGGSGSYKWSVSSGSLPPGLVLTAAGRIKGKPTEKGTFGFSARATDGDGLPTRPVSPSSSKPDPPSRPRRSLTLRSASGIHQP